MNESGFFFRFSKRVAEAINANFKDGAPIEVKRIRKIMDVGSGDRSAIIFLARSLGAFERMGFLKNGAKQSPKRYVKLRDIVFTAEEIAKKS